MLLLLLLAVVDAAFLRDYNIRRGVGEISDQKLEDVGFEPGVETGVYTNTEFTKNTYSRQPYVANGYIGSRVANLGFGFSYDEWNPFVGDDQDFPIALNNGWPLHNKRFSGAFASGFYCNVPELNATNYPELDKLGYPSAIASIPQWNDMSIEFNGQVLEASADVNVSDYTQSMSSLTGSVTTEFKWNDLWIKTTVMAHRGNSRLGLVSLEVSTDSNSTSVSFKVSDILDFSTSQRTWLHDANFDDNGIYITLQPENTPNSLAALYSVVHPVIIGAACNQTLSVSKYNGQGMSSQTVSVTLSPGQVFKMEKYVGVMTTEFDESMSGSELELAKGVAVNASTTGYDDLEQQHVEEWSQLMQQQDIHIPSDDWLSEAIHASFYHLLANTRSDSTKGLPLAVPGLSSDSYAGMVFWDTDIWIMPALLPFHPEVSKKLMEYRVDMFEQAQENAKFYNYSGAVYPWTSTRQGNCTSTGPCVDYEYHINVDIVMSLLNVYLSGAGDEMYLRDTVWPVMSNVTEFFTEYVKYNETTDTYHTLNLTDPDEFANHVDDGAFTNAGIKMLMNWTIDVATHLGYPVDEKWMDISTKLVIPQENGITLEYDSMNSSTEVKQADVVLNTYPLPYVGYQDQDKIKVAQNDLAYYSKKQSASGPAMTWPVFSAVSAQLLNFGCSSQSFLLKSMKPFLRGPFWQFSEQANDDVEHNGLTNPAFPFLTGHGGMLQGFIYGLTGMRFTYTMNNGSIERLLVLNPITLPTLKDGFSVRGVKYNGSSFDLNIGDDYATITTYGAIKVFIPNRNVLASGQGKDGKTLLLQNQTYSIPLFETYKNIPNNVVECMRVTNLTAGVPGDVPESIIDGNNYTTWQPLTANKASIFIDLGKEIKLSNGLIIWGESLPQNFSLRGLSHFEDLSIIEGNSSCYNEQALRKFVGVNSYSNKDLCNIGYQYESIEDQFETIVESTNVTQDEFPASSQIELPDIAPNTTFSINSNKSYRFVILDFEGGEDNVGGVIAEFALF